MSEGTFHTAKESFLRSEGTFLPRVESFLAGEGTLHPVDETFAPEVGMFDRLVLSFLPTENPFLSGNVSFHPIEPRTPTPEGALASHSLWMDPVYQRQALAGEPPLLHLTYL